MNLSKYGLLLGLLIVMFVSGMVGAHFGYNVNGIPHGGILLTGSPGILGVVEWVWGSIVFMFQMTTFQVDNMPIVVNAIFGIMSIMTVFLIVSLIRGN